MGGHTSRALGALLVATSALVGGLPGAGANHIPLEDTCPDPGNPDHWDAVILGGKPQFVIDGTLPPGCFVHAGCDLGPDPCRFVIDVTVRGTGLVQGAAMNQATGETFECGPVMDECSIQFSATRANDLQVTCGSGDLTIALDFTLFCRNVAVGPA